MPNENRQKAADVLTAAGDIANALTPVLVAGSVISGPASLAIAGILQVTRIAADLLRQDDVTLDVLAAADVDRELSEARMNAAEAVALAKATS